MLLVVVGGITPNWSVKKIKNEGKNAKYTTDCIYLFKIHINSLCTVMISSISRGVIFSFFLLYRFTVGCLLYTSIVLYTNVKSYKN